jgi:transposase
MRCQESDRGEVLLNEIRAKGLGSSSWNDDAGRTQKAERRGEAGLPVICVETRPMRAVLKAQINKTDRNDARGLAQMMRVGLYRPVHVKTIRSQKLRMPLTHRKLLQSKAIAIEARIKELVENLPDVAVLVEPLLVVRRVLREQVGILHRRLLAIVRDDDVCWRLMTVPGVGPVVALTYRATVDVLPASGTPRWSVRCLDRRPPGINRARATASAGYHGGETR